MAVFINCLLLLVLFWLLGVAANIAVNNIKRLAAILKLRFFAVGVLMAIATTLPELAIGVHASLNNVTTISVGNLLGGIPLIFGAILGIGLILNRKISTAQETRSIIPEIIVIFSPILLGLNGKYGTWDGIIIIGLYLAVLFYIARGRLSKQSMEETQEEMQYYSTIRILSLSLIGLGLIVLLSSWILLTTTSLLKQLQISELILGIVVFSIGTNLPEFTIVVASWYKKVPELSLDYLIGSALANVLVLGILALLRPIEFAVDYSFIVLGAFLGIMLVLFIIFYRSDKEMDRQEGFVLFGVYVLFLVVNFIIIRLQAISNIS